MSSVTHPQQTQPHLVNKLQPPPVNGMSPNNISPSSAQYESSPAETVSSNVSQQPEPTVSGPTSKKGKVKKTTDPLETSKLLAAKISQLESDRAGEKDIEAEIGELSPSLTKLAYNLFPCINTLQVLLLPVKSLWSNGRDSKLLGFTINVLGISSITIFVASYE